MTDLIYMQITIKVSTLYTLPPLSHVVAISVQLSQYPSAYVQVTLILFNNSPTVQ